MTELKQDDGKRPWIVISYWLTVLLLGLPLWWWTTLVPRASVSSDMVAALTSQFRQDRQLLDRTVTVNLMFMGTAERSGEFRVPIEKYHLSTRICTGTRDIARVKVSSFALDISSVARIHEVAQLLPESTALTSHWDLYVMQIEALPRLVRQGNPAMVHFCGDRRVLIAVDEELEEGSEDGNIIL